MKLLRIFLVLTIFSFGFVGICKRPDIFFTEKNIINYSITNYPIKGNGGVMTRVLEVTDIKQSVSGIASTIDATQYNYAGARYGRYVYNFASDSTCFYVSAANWSYQFSISGNSVNKGDSLHYPFAMKVGDTLPDAWSYSKLVTSGETISEDWRFYKRKVMGTDTLKTPLGSAMAFRIEMKIQISKTEDIVTGDEVRKKKTWTITEWFVPELGIVKTLKDDPDYGTSVTVMESFTK